MAFLPLLRFATEHIPERPAVPKEIIFLDKLPLTAVGKPIKHVLQLDAAKRVFNDALRDVNGNWRLDVVHTGGGLKTTFVLSGEQPEVRERAEEILSSFSTPYEVRVER